MTALDKSAECNKTRHDVDINFLLLLFPINFHYSNIILKKVVIIIILIHQPYSQVFGRLTKGQNCVLNDILVSVPQFSISIPGRINFI